MRTTAWMMDAGLNKHVVDISDFVVSDDPEALLVTYSLGSCMGLAVYDPVAMIGGLLHCLLPFSSIKPSEAKRCPAMFVDTGVPAMLETMLSWGAQKERLILKAAGCGQIFSFDTVFRVGSLNYQTLITILGKNSLRLAAEHVGGTLSRTMRLRIKTGQVTVHASGQHITL